MLLASPGQDFTDDEGAAIIAQANTAVSVEGRDDLITPAEAAENLDETLEPDEFGIINRGNGWYELPDGERIRGRVNAEAALGVLTADEVTPVPTIEDQIPDGGTLGDLEAPGVAVIADDLSGGDHAVDDDGTGTRPDIDPGELETMGGGWFRLPNGERIRGREEAEAAMAALDPVVDDSDGEGTLP